MSHCVNILYLTLDSGSACYFIEVILLPKVLTEKCSPI
jgi:hypothetical protein